MLRFAPCNELPVLREVRPFGGAVIIIWKMIITGY